MKKHKKLYSIIAVALTIVLVLSTVTVLAVKTVQNGKKTLYEKVLEEDGFIYGINYLNPGETGHTWADNEVYGYNTNSFSDGVGAEWVKEDAYNMKRLGYNCVQIVALGYQCEGIDYGENGEIIGLTDEFKKNYREYIKILSEAGLNLGVIINFHETIIYSELGKNAWDKATQYYCNPEVRKVYFEKCVTPVLDILKDYEDSIMYIALGDELENMINDSELQFNTVESDRSVYGVTFDTMYGFISDLNDLVKEKLPNIPRTIDCNADFLNKYEDLDLTFIGHNQYSEDGSVKDIARFKTSLPVFKSEYGLGSYTDETSYNKGNLKMLDNIIDAGYVGAMWWAYGCGAHGTDLWTLFNGEFAFRSDYNHLATQFMFKTMDNINAYKGIEVEFEPATVFYNAGKGRISWVNSRQAVKIDIERSIDGGKTWTKVVTSADIKDYEHSGNIYMGTYIDPDLEIGKEACYRIVSYNEDGKSNTSEATNVAERKTPNPNLVTNGDFENGMEGWTKNSGSGTNNSDAVKEAAYNGEKGLLISSDSLYYGVAQDIEVKPNTSYYISYKYKVLPGYADGVGTATYLKNYYGEGSVDIWPQEYNNKAPDGSDNGWCTAGFIINSGNNSKFSLQFLTTEPTPAPSYIDNVSVVELS